MNTTFLKKIRKHHTWKWDGNKWIVLDHKNKSVTCYVKTKAFIVDWLMFNKYPAAGYKYNLKLTNREKRIEYYNYLKKFKNEC